MPSQVWLSHPSLEYAHLSASASCGYVAISLIPGVRPSQPPLCSASCGYVTISPIPGVRPPLCLCQLRLRDYLTYPWSTHTTPSQVWLSHPSLKYTHHAHLSASARCGYLTYPGDHAHHAHPSSSCGYVASNQSLEYAHHAQPSVPISPIPGVRPPSASCGYMAISLIPGAYPPRSLFYQLWLCHQSLEYAQRT